jgi:hypothetical protein
MRLPLANNSLLSSSESVGVSIAISILNNPVVGNESNKKIDKTDEFFI